MKMKKLVSVIGICSALLFSSNLLTDCTSMITEEQLLKLQDLRKRESQLNQEISDKQTDMQKVERELNSRKTELNDCQKERDFIKQKLSQWPNVWPD